METKSICVLANSIKFGKRCVAGMEVTSTGEHKWHLSKQWLRPISHREDGALNALESRITVHGHQPELYDILEIDLHGKAHVDGQPEDWLIEEGRMWRKTGHFGTDVIAKLAEKPANLEIASN